MANIAQTINVLQSVILTDGTKMLLTPTYHVFDMYKVHHDAVKLPVYLDCEQVNGMPSLSASASLDDDNVIHISVVNIDPVNEKKVKIALTGCVTDASVKLSGQILSTEEMQAHNTFDKPETVKLNGFNGASISDNAVNVDRPAKSSVTLELS
jgi:alpha-N-arabinofuranosidase